MKLLPILILSAMLCGCGEHQDTPVRSSHLDTNWYIIQYAYKEDGLYANWFRQVSTNCSAGMWLKAGQWPN